MDRNILSQIKSHFLSALSLSFFIAEHVAPREIFLSFVTSLFSFMLVHGWQEKPQKAQS